MRSGAFVASERHELIPSLVVLAILPPVILVILLVGVSSALAPLLSGEVASLVSALVGLAGGLVAMPLIYAKMAGHPLSMSRLGLVRPTRKTIVLMAGVCAVSVILAGVRGAALPLLLAQHVPISVCEEFWSKGVLLGLSKLVFRPAWLVIGVPGVIFAFVLHSSEPILVNLIIRLPLGLITGYVFYKTRCLFWPVVLHFAYNITIF